MVMLGIDDKTDLLSDLFTAVETSTTKPELK